MILTLLLLGLGVVVGVVGEHLLGVRRLARHGQKCFEAGKRFADWPSDVQSIFTGNVTVESVTYSNTGKGQNA